VSKVFGVLAVLLMLTTACSSGGTAPGPTAANGANPSTSVAANPVDLLKKLGASTTDTVGQAAPFGERYAMGHWGSQDPVGEPDGTTTWGQSVEVDTFPTHDQVADRLAGTSPSDHDAIVAGDLWIVDLHEGQKSGKWTFDPTPQQVADKLGGRVVHVWP
jgi:hypothetical protein